MSSMDLWSFISSECKISITTNPSSWPFMSIKDGVRGACISHEQGDYVYIRTPEDSYWLIHEASHILLSHTHYEISKNQKESEKEIEAFVFSKYVCDILKIDYNKQLHFKAVHEHCKKLHVMCPSKATEDCIYEMAKDFCKRYTVFLSQRKNRSPSKTIRSIREDISRGH